MSSRPDRLPHAEEIAAAGTPPTPAPLPRHARLLPMVVSLPLFLQNVDTSIMGPALPAMAVTLHVNALRLNVAITAYLISLAIFLPASGWLADRFGPRRVFCTAIGLFSIASALCGLANTLPELVACRVLQGLGGAMMVPVGRLILWRSVPASAMVAAMVWFTIPPVIGRLIGPLVGGVTVTWLSWRWIFLINVPIGAIAITLASWLIEGGGESEERRPFDVVGFLLLGLGLAVFLIALEGAINHLVSLPVSLLAGIAGLICLGGYVWRSRRVADSMIDLSVMRFKTFHISIFAGMPLRLAIGALPFLLPLLLQVGFGLSPLRSGLLTMASALGSLSTRGLLKATLKRLGFRRTMMIMTVIASLTYVVYANFRPSTPEPAMFCAMLVGGTVMSMALIALQTLSFSEVPKPLMTHATALSAMAQQLSLSLGVLMVVELLRVSVWWRGGDAAALLPRDFSVAFLGVAAALLLALPSFRRLDPQAGAAMTADEED